MSVQAHIYGNSGSGPVNYASPIATVATAPWTYNVGPMAEPSDWEYAVRNFDSVSTLEEKNVDAVVEIDVGPAGQDLTGLPNPPISLAARTTAAGTAVVTWAYNTGGQGAPPTGFHVYIGTPTISYASAITTVAYTSGLLNFTANLSGLTSGATYQVGVRSYNAAGTETNTTVITFSAQTGGPLPITNLLASVLG